MHRSTTAGSARPSAATWSCSSSATPGRACWRSRRRSTRSTTGRTAAWSARSAGTSRTATCSSFCVDQVDARELVRLAAAPVAAGAARHVQYDRYLVDEVVPFTPASQPQPLSSSAAGPSFGAYHAVNFAFATRTWSAGVLGMSGHLRYKALHGRVLRRRTSTSTTRVDFLANEHDAGTARRAEAAGHHPRRRAGRPAAGQNQQLSTLLWSKDVWHALRIWDGFAHDWPVWAQDAAAVHRRATTDGGRPGPWSDWTEDNFGNDGARDYLAMHDGPAGRRPSARWSATTTGIDPDEDGESLLMPSVEMLALLCERCNAAPPRPATVQAVARRSTWRRSTRASTRWSRPPSSRRRGAR